MTHIDIPFQKEELQLQEVDFPYQCKSIYESIILKRINDKCNNVSCCMHSNFSQLEKIPIDTRSIIEINCCGLLPSNFVCIPDHLANTIFPEDFVVVTNYDSIEIAQVKAIGELVKKKRQYIGLYKEDLLNVTRKATIEDLDRTRKNISDEQNAAPKFRSSALKFNLDMKLVSIHYQFDRKKLFFFYTADGRIDFRELAKELASEFKTRIELRQIGVRDEAKKIGGVGSCGRQFCCFSFLNNFKRITTQLASDQNIASNMGKLSGPCNKLKCCLSFETE
ncbi:MAG: PSP1 domain protein [Ignavibacteria bacterium]|nr:MAG: PSP1 domain protein [Ignavibacteria bacterium]KAF0162085.1 MAG: PSP1 domain protein [Ignavibacteria bacterium]